MRQLLHLIIYIALLAAALVGCTTEAERNRMRSGLDSINARNRTDQPFTPQDVQPYVQFFDSQGDANDRLLAHYLLGRAYHEKGDAPMALECYQHALDCADTTAMSDKDFAQLSRVYAQMAEILYRQGLYREQINHILPSVKYASQGKDTLAALMSYEMQCSAYRKLGKSDSILIVADSVYEKYNTYGYPNKAAVALSNIFSILIDRKDFRKVKDLLDIYESKSLFFDSLGNIVHGREIYYKVKGYYYKGLGMLDSADYYFRKELCYGKDYNNQNAGALGLAEVFMAKHMPDSASKYYKYSYTMNDSMHARKTTTTIERMQAMYDYSRHQEVAKMESEKATKRMTYLWICIGLILLLLLIVTICMLVLRDMRVKRKLVEAEYRRSIETINQAKKELSLLQLYKELNAQLIENKQQLIREQNAIKKALLQKSKKNQNDAMIHFKSLPIFDVFTKCMDKGKNPTRTEWADFQDAIFISYPGFSEFMQKHNEKLTDREFKICVLIRADFKPVSIGNVLGIAASSITQIRSDLHQKLFKEPGNSKDFDNHIKRIF